MAKLPPGTAVASLSLTVSCDGRPPALLIMRCQLGNAPLLLQAPMADQHSNAATQSHAASAEVSQNVAACMLPQQVRWLTPEHLRRKTVQMLCSEGTLVHLRGAAWLLGNI